MDGSPIREWEVENKGEITLKKLFLSLQRKSAKLGS